MNPIKKSVSSFCFLQDCTDRICHFDLSGRAIDPASERALEQLKRTRCVDEWEITLHVKK